jgi:hypothetical protein
MIVTGSLNADLKYPTILNNILSKPRRQSFSLPIGIIHSMKFKPLSQKGYQKLQQTCKYFCWGKRILIADNFYVKENSNDLLLLFLTRIDALSPDLLYKIWINRSLSFIIQNPSHVMTQLLNNVYRCDLVDLTVTNQVFTYDEYLMLTGSGSIKTFYFFNVTVKYSDDKVVPFECLLEKLPNLVDLRWFVLSSIGFL